MYLDFLENWDAGYSWGAAGLAYLYHSVSEYHIIVSNIMDVCCFGFWHLIIYTCFVA